MLRPENAGSNTAAAHIAATNLALGQLPAHTRRRVLVRADSGGGTHEFVAWLTKPGRRLAYSVGFTITEDAQHAVTMIPAQAWTPAYDGDGQVRTRPPGATAGQHVTRRPDNSDQLAPSSHRYKITKDRG